MTRKTAVIATALLTRIETYETLIDEIQQLSSLEELMDTDLEDELVAVVQARLDKTLQELEKL